MANTTNNITINTAAQNVIRYKVKVAGIDNEYEIPSTAGTLTDDVILRTIASIVPSVNPADYRNLTWTAGTDEQGSYMRTSLIPKAQNKGFEIFVYAC